jgi:hypothetical protein
MSKKIKYLKCIHNLYWKTCNICKDHTEKEILNELNNFSQKEKTEICNYQILDDIEVPEADIAYDLENSN